VIAAQGRGDLVWPGDLGKPNAPACSWAAPQRGRL